MRSPHTLRKQGLDTALVTIACPPTVFEPQPNRLYYSEPSCRYSLQLSGNWEGRLPAFGASKASS